MADNQMHQTTDHITTGVAVAGVTITFWFPSLHDVSAIAADWVPILSLLWILFQFGLVVIRWTRAKRQVRYVRRARNRSRRDRLDNRDARTHDPLA